MDNLRVGFLRLFLLLSFLNDTINVLQNFLFLFNLVFDLINFLMNFLFFHIEGILDLISFFFLFIFVFLFLNFLLTFSITLIVKVWEFRLDLILLFLIKLVRSLLNLSRMNYLHIFRLFLFLNKSFIKLLHLALLSLLIRLLLLQLSLSFLLGLQLLSRLFLGAIILRIHLRFILFAFFAWFNYILRLERIFLFRDFFHCQLTGFIAQSVINLIINFCFILLNLSLNNFFKDFLR